MLGFVVGSLCLIGLFKLRRMRRMGWAYGYGGHHHGCARDEGFGPGPFAGDERSGGFGFGRRAGLHGLFRALDATPAQEKVILAAVEEVRAAAREARGEWKQSRVDLAGAFRAESFDAEVMGNAFARHDEHLERLRKAVTGALAQIHDALDAQQRARLAEWLDAGGMRGFAGFGGRGFGIYR